MTSQLPTCRPAEQNESHVENPPALRTSSKAMGQIIWRGRWLILFATVSVLAATSVYLNVATPMYTSTSKIYVEQEGPRILMETEGRVMTQSNNYLYTQAELLRSEPILTRALNYPSMKQPETISNVNYSVGYLKRNLDIQVGKKDDIISVSLDSPDPNEAAQRVNAVVDSYISYHETRIRRTLGEVTRILRTEEAKHRRELLEKNKTMADFKKEIGLFALENERGNMVLQGLDRLSTFVTEAQLATIENKAIYESTKAMVTDPASLKQFIEAQRAKGVYIAPGSDRAELESKLDRLERFRQATSDQTELKTLDTEIDNVNKRIADLDARFIQAKLGEAQQQYLAAKEKEDRVTKHFEEQRQHQQVLELNEQLAEYAILQSDWEQKRELCNGLRQRIEQLSVIEDAGALNISILEVARPAHAPSKPQKATSMAIALVLGSMLGGALALFRDWLDPRPHSAQEISAILSAPLVGVVPSMPRSRWQTVGIRAKMVHVHTTSSTAEAYRAIRTAVSFGVLIYKAKTIVITSPAQGDGKTTLVSNLAIAMAQGGERVLVADADFRNPMQHRIFNISKAPGLSSVVAGTRGLDKLDEAIQPSSIAGLDILPSGPGARNPSRILNTGHSFANTMTHLCSKYDRILIDSPPVVPFADSCVLAAICDATLLVVRAEKSTRMELQQARDALLGVGAHILGAVANDVPRRNDLYGRYYHRYRYRRVEKKSGHHRILDVAANTRHHVRSGNPTS